MTKAINFTYSYGRVHVSWDEIRKYLLATGAPSWLAEATDKEVDDDGVSFIEPGDHTPTPGRAGVFWFNIHYYLLASGVPGWVWQPADTKTDATGVWFIEHVMNLDDQMMKNARGVLKGVWRKTQTRGDYA